MLFKIFGFLFLSGAFLGPLIGHDFNLADFLILALQCLAKIAIGAIKLFQLCISIFQKL
jgi:hypothetical protein